MLAGSWELLQDFCAECWNPEEERASDVAVSTHGGVLLVGALIVKDRLCEVYSRGPLIVNSHVQILNLPLLRAWQATAQQRVSRVSVLGLVNMALGRYRVVLGTWTV